MPTIYLRRRKDGSLACLAELRIKRAGRTVHRESKTFDQRRQAKERAANKEKQLNKADALPQHLRQSLRGPLRKIVARCRTMVLVASPTLLLTAPISWAISR
jgi:hypothetical protein